jgi:hypothetical protein
MRLPALKNDLGDKVEAAGAVWVRVMVREWKDLAGEPKGTRVKSEKPGAKIPRPVGPREALRTGEVEERAFKGVKLQSEGQCICLDSRIIKRVKGPVALWASSVARTSPEAGDAQRRSGGDRRQRVDSREMVNTGCHTRGMEPVRDIGQEGHETKPPGQAWPVSRLVR